MGIKTERERDRAGEGKNFVECDRDVFVLLFQVKLCHKNYCLLGFGIDGRKRPSDVRKIIGRS